MVQFYYKQINVDLYNLLLTNLVTSSMNIQHDEQQEEGMFFIEEEAKIVAKMTYKVRSGNMVIEHTLVDESLRGKDVGARLVGEGVNFARQKNMKIVPVCTYAKKLLERSKEYNDVLADQ